jgi:hypothetical protein
MGMGMKRWGLGKEEEEGVEQTELVSAANAMPVSSYWLCIGFIGKCLVLGVETMSLNPAMPSQLVEYLLDNSMQFIS